MKTVIYADILIVINLIVNYLLLRATSVILGAKRSSVRFLISSALGGVFSLIIFVENIPFLLNAVIKIVFLSVMVCVAFNIRKLSDFLKNFAAFFLCNFAFAGMMLAINIFVSSEATIYKNGVVYFDIDIITLVGASIGCYAVLSLISKFTRSRMVRNLLYDISVTYNGKSVSGKALLDTGNTLKDGFSGKPVIIAEKHFIGRIIPENADITRMNSFRLIPYSTIHSGGALPAFLADEITVNFEGQKIALRDIYVAVTEKKIVSSDYSVLLGAPFLEAVIKHKTDEERREKTDGRCFAKARRNARKNKIKDF